MAAVLDILRVLRRRLAPRLNPAGVFAALAWLRWGRRRRPAPRSDGPVIVAGFHGSVLGVGEAARSLSAGLRAQGLAVTDWDVSALFGHERRIEAGSPAPPPAGPGVLIAHMNPPELVQLAALHGAAPFQNRRVIGYWAWELERLPKPWRAAFRYVDAVWAPSRFTADAVCADAPHGLPVRVLPHPAAAIAAGPDRARFRLPDDAVAVLTAFDLRSTTARKNPLAAIAAFEMARAQAQTPAVLLLKVVGASPGSPQLAELEARIKASPDIRLMTDALSAADRDALLASVDIVLSLHRAEGFGLLLAEGMAAAKAVIATAWSGNLDFMTDETAALIPAQLVAVNDTQGMYAGGRWADADIAAAAAALARLIDDAAARQALGARARAHVAAILAPDKIAARAAAWIKTA